VTNKRNFGIWFSSNIFLIATAALQLLGFIILGRALGAIEYGKILAVTVFVSLGVEFVGLGCGDSLIKRVSTEKKAYPMMIRECIRLCLITLIPVSTIIITLLTLFTQSEFTLIAVLVLTELYSTRFLALIDHSSIANKDITYLNTIKLTYATLRLAVIASAVYVFSISNAWSWIPFQIICTFIITSVLFFTTVKRYGGIERSSDIQIDLKESLLFSLTQTSRALQNNIDKYAVQLIFSPLLFSLYAVAGRFLQYSLIPLQAVLRMSYPKFFQAEKTLKNSSVTLAIKLTPVIIAASAIPFSFLLWGGFIVEFLLGDSYEGVSTYMSLLAPLPVILGLQYICMDLLTALDSHRTRLTISAIHVLTLCCYFFSFSSINIEHLVTGFIYVNAIFVCFYFTFALLNAFYFKQSMDLD
jgi:O-antigen/teichoic acid export membrane protein